MRLDTIVIGPTNAADLTATARVMIAAAIDLAAADEATEAMRAEVCEWQYRSSTQR